jgi:hypothetical protein
LLLALDVAIADVRQAEQAISPLTENLSYGAAHSSKAHQRNPARGGGIGVQWLLWLSLVQCLLSKWKLFFIIRGSCGAAKWKAGTQRAACQAELASKLVI